MKATSLKIVTLCSVLTLYFSAAAQNRLHEEQPVIDADSWYDLHQVTLSDDGRWIAFKKDHVGDSIFISDTHTGKLKGFGDNTAYDMRTDTGEVLLKNNSGWVYGNLRRDVWKTLPFKKQYFFSGNVRYLLWKDDNAIGTYDLRNVKGADVELAVVDEVFTAERARAVVYTKANEGRFEVYRMDGSTFKSTFVTMVDDKPFGLVFDALGESFAFGTKNKEEGNVMYVAVREKDGWKTIVRPLGHQWNGQKLMLDGQKSSVYFETADSLKLKVKNPMVEIRHSLEERQEATRLHQVVWDYGRNTETILCHPEVSQVFNTAVPGVFLGFDTRFYDLRDTRSIEHADLVLLVGDKSLLIEKDIELLSNHVLVHPKKPYVLYYKSGFWWSYNLKTGKKICLNTKLPYGFENHDKNYLYAASHYGAMGWGANASVFLYDRYDVWKFNLDGSGSQRLTKGKEEGLTYRNAEDALLSADFLRTFSIKLPTVSDEDYLLFRVHHPETERYGIAVLTRLNSLKMLFPLDRYRYRWVEKVGRKELIVKRSGHNVPPQFMIVQKDGSVRWKYQTNRNHIDKPFGDARLVTVPLEDGKTSKAALFYPTGFKLGKKYPMVVYYYEKTSSQINDFVVPSYFNQDGFNRTLLTQNGFFVLNVDMRYKDNEVSRYLLEDTNRILDGVVELEPGIDSERLGMFGFSFGGYEALYLIGQTNRFKAVVAGAGVSDLYDIYYSEKDKGSLGMETIENLQLRTAAPYQNPNFNKTNPIMFVDRIETPLLLWSGDADYRVSKNHSVKMYLALKKQKKEAVLLLYKGEYHTIDKPENQQDLSQRILDFYTDKLK